jgi:hypothetical protein
LGGVAAGCAIFMFVDSMYPGSYSH